ncbi:MAG: hypothetical protein J0L55_11500 [Caulobacterales bacterium]|nr:hypothetical protein [Caulobacterales bacterium]MCA0373327.1 ATP F0F1 synthase subunit B [Pseudomonadota bacterium]
MIHFDATTVAAVAFLIFVCGLIFGVKLPSVIGNSLDEQSNAIAKELDHAKQLRIQAEELRKSYEAQQKQAEEDAKALIAQAETDAKELKKRAKSQLEADIAAKTKAANDRIERAQANAINEVRSFAANAAIDAAQKMMIAGSSGKDADKLFASSLKNIETSISKVQ